MTTESPRATGQVVRLTNGQLYTADGFVREDLWIENGRIVNPTELFFAERRQLPRQAGDAHGAAVLGVHIEGPFIHPEKKGAHPEQWIRSSNLSIADVEAVYGSLDNVAYVTMAPELENAVDVTRELVRRGVRVSLGHTHSNLEEAHTAILAGASCLTHLFNAMTGFHHRNPGVIGLLPYAAEDRFTMYYGLIVDGYHTHDASIRLAHAMHPRG
ncbi:uncharacterized protein MONBRDRAFT_12259 [Monosiga brevicollis MX1]|uniref:N-acetylglucosamine-6-phosphate deacetylase n=1 Tax=Monosiga brevicollis TaxID=81824 RepID=A9VBQ0_MONBE|nr:uncharacterized protein MONBRDRAFT_12259 [Monosiga brevicollis MX1]EDQ84971.1 predicted protein [Monosiga brevicollis MX1]|eukprot:XP_001750141.1 hypothetical protein [Monosiga brevicollis MX1]